MTARNGQFIGRRRKCLGFSFSATRSPMELSLLQYVDPIALRQGRALRVLIGDQSGNAALDICARQTPAISTAGS